MADWAIRDPKDSVLEPSFGGCGFLQSCADKFVEFGCGANDLPLYGCDIDKNAFSYLSKTVGSLVDLSNFALGDYLALDKPRVWPHSFDVIIGNPPYVSYHGIANDAREYALEAIREIGLNLDLRASLWAYFVALSLRYLQEGGRVAWVLPGSFLYANYSRDLRVFLSANFKKIGAFSIKERLFLHEGTDEQTVVLLAEGYRKNREKLAAFEIPLWECRTLAELSDAIDVWDQFNRKVKAASTCESPILSTLDEENRVVYERLVESYECQNLGVFLDARIGLVTGANHFFVIDKEKAETFSLDDSDTYPVVAKFSSVRGVSFSKHDYNKELKQGGRCILISACDEDTVSPNLRGYLETFPYEKISTVATFAKRQPWFKTYDTKIPDAFFPVMNHSGPRLALNVGCINCTNSIHRVFFKQKLDKHTRKLLAVSLLSSFSQLSAEFEGRQYGSGVLKHEPREVERIKILIPKVSEKIIETAFTEVDSLLKKNQSDKARARADRFVLEALCPQQEEKATFVLQEALRKVREKRYPDRKKK